MEEYKSSNELASFVSSSPSETSDLLTEMERVDEEASLDGKGALNKRDTVVVDSVGSKIVLQQPALLDEAEGTGMALVLAAKRVRACVIAEGREGDRMRL
mgnify:CR=1 FL=1